MESPTLITAQLDPVEITQDDREAGRWEPTLVITLLTVVVVAELIGGIYLGLLIARSANGG